MKGKRKRERLKARERERHEIHDARASSPVWLIRERKQPRGTQAETRVLRQAARSPRPGSQDFTAATQQDKKTRQKWCGRAELTRWTSQAARPASRTALPPPSVIYVRGRTFEWIGEGVKDILGRVLSANPTEMDKIERRERGYWRASLSVASFLNGTEGSALSFG